MLNYNIYIPSKGRAGKCYTADILAKEGVPFTIVVEPQEVEEYTKAYAPNADIRCLPESNRGIAYVRNFIKGIAESANSLAYWCIDDNIKAFRRRADGKNRLIVAKIALSEAEEFFDSYRNIGGCGLSHSVFAWTRDDEIGLNKQIYSCMLLRTDINISYREDTIEDTDYCMQLLTHPDRWCTVLFHRLLIDKVTSGEMKGGNTEISHAGDGRQKRSERLQEYWPNTFKLRRNRKGEVRVAPSRIWSTFTQELREYES